MTSSGMLRRVALVRTDVSEELSASVIRVTRIGELGTLAVTRTDARCVLHSHRRENLKSYRDQTFMSRDLEIIIYFRIFNLCAPSY
jgi:demethoxyubiquinone hydroxylase (CLK1/Coq7/Cat5 family)